MSIDVPKLRAELADISEQYLGDIAPPGRADLSRQTYPALSCLLLAAIYEQMELNISIQRKILRAIRKDDDD